MSEQELELNDIKLLPNLWTCLQFITLPMMFYSVLQEDLNGFLTWYLATFFVDATDGTMARTMGVQSRLGLFLDSYFDLTMFILTFVSLYLLIPEFLLEYVWILVGLFGANFVNRAISFVRFKRVLMMHMYTSKAIYFFMTVFVVDYVISGEPSHLLFIIMLIDSAVFVVEEFLSIRWLREPRDDVLTVFEVIRENRGLDRQ